MVQALGETKVVAYVDDLLVGRNTQGEHDCNLLHHLLIESQPPLTAEYFGLGGQFRHPIECHSQTNYVFCFLFVCLICSFICFLIVNDLYGQACRFRHLSLCITSFTASFPNLRSWSKDGLDLPCLPSEKKQWYLLSEIRCHMPWLLF